MNKSQVLLHISIYIKETGRNSRHTAMKLELATGRAICTIKRMRNINNGEPRKHSIAQQNNTLKVSQSFSLTNQSFNLTISNSYTF